MLGPPSVTAELQVLTRQRRVLPQHSDAERRLSLRVAVSGGLLERAHGRPDGIRVLQGLEREDVVVFLFTVPLAGAKHLVLGPTKRFLGRDLCACRGR